MNNVAHVNNPRPSKSTMIEPTRTRNHEVATLDAADEDQMVARATLIDAVRAELSRARGLIAAEPTKAADALDVANDLVDTIENKLSDMVALAREAEEALGPAAIAFAVLDHRATEIGSVARERSSFNMAFGQAVADLQALLREAHDVTNDEHVSAREETREAAAE
jgi:hypothetical protein